MTPPAANENLTCDECGRYGAIDFGERKLCPDCYESCGFVLSGVWKRRSSLES